MSDLHLLISCNDAQIHKPRIGSTSIVSLRMPPDSVMSLNMYVLHCSSTTQMYSLQCYGEMLSSLCRRARRYHLERRKSSRQQAAAKTETRRLLVQCNVRRAPRGSFSPQMILQQDDPSDFLVERQITEGFSRSNHDVNIRPGSLQDMDSKNTITTKCFLSCRIVEGQKTTLLKR